MAHRGYRGLDEELFRKSYFESNGDALKASKLGNFEYSHRTYAIIWRRLGLITRDEGSREKRAGDRYAFGDLPEAAGRPRRFKAPMITSLFSSSR
jgi:hypothetical protein